MGNIFALMIALQFVFFTNQRNTHPIPDHIEIYKSKHILYLKSNNKIVQSYPALFGAVDGKKERSGDMKTPEGRYTVIGKNGKSEFLHSLHINYPNENDKNHAKKLGVHPGNEITIHGTGNVDILNKSIKKLKNSTRGCVAVANHHIKHLYRHVPIGTVVDIHP